VDLRGRVLERKWIWLVLSRAFGLVHAAAAV